MNDPFVDATAALEHHVQESRRGLRADGVEPLELIDGLRSPVGTFVNTASSIDDLSTGLDQAMLLADEAALLGAEARVAAGQFRIWIDSLLEHREVWDLDRIRLSSWQQEPMSDDLALSIIDDCSQRHVGWPEDLRIQLLFVARDALQVEALTASLSRRKPTGGGVAAVGTVRPSISRIAISCLIDLTKDRPGVKEPACRALATLFADPLTAPLIARRLPYGRRLQAVASHLESACDKLADVLSAEASLTSSEHRAATDALLWVLAGRHLRWLAA